MSFTYEGRLSLAAENQFESHLDVPIRANREEKLRHGVQIDMSDRMLGFVYVSEGKFPAEEKQRDGEVLLHFSLHRYLPLLLAAFKAAFRSETVRWRLLLSSLLSSLTSIYEIEALSTSCFVNLLLARRSRRPHEVQATEG